MMLETPPLPPRQLFAPTILALAIIASAPFMSLLRRGLFDLFPERGVLILGVGLALLLLAALGAALARIRSRRALRYTGLTLVLVALWVQSTHLSPELPRGLRLQVALTERIHIVEYGGLAFLLVGALRNRGLICAARLATVWATLAGVLDEMVQFMAPSRTGEARDIGINAAAAATGALFALCVAPDAWWRQPQIAARAWLTAMVRSLAVLVLAAGIFVLVAHLGYRIDDPVGGRFLSWYTPEQLRTLAADRAEHWAGPNPPTGREICCLQDYYLSEASRHNAHRNERYADGDFLAAWHVDNLLHTFYEPYLDKPLPPDGRLPRDEVDHDVLVRAAKGHAAGTYTSPVLRGRIWTRPSKSAWLALTLILAGSLWWAPTVLLGKRQRESRPPG